MFGMNVQAQNNTCNVTLIVNLENIKDTNTIFVSESNIIGVNNIIKQGNTITYTLDKNEDYIFQFQDEEVDKIFLLKTSNVCGNTLISNVDMNKRGSAASFWENGQYKHVYYNDKGH